MNEQELAVWHEYMRQGTKYLAKTMYVQAEKIFGQAAVLASRLAVPEIIAFNVRLLATTRFKLGDIDEAELGFKEAEKICSELNNAKGLAEAWTGLGNVALRRGLYEQAVAYLAQAIQIYPDDSPPLRLGMILSDLGHAYAFQKDWRKAVDAYEQARTYCRYYKYPKGEAELSLLLGEIASRCGDYRQARKYLRDAGGLYARLEDWRSLAEILQFAALVEYSADQFPEAEDTQRRAMLIWLNLDMEEELSEACFFLSRIDQSLNAMEEAEYYLNVSIKYYGKQDVGLGLRYQSLAGIAVSALDFTRAEEYYHQARQWYDAVNEVVKLSEVYTSLAMICEIQDNKPEALEYYQKSVAVWHQPNKRMVETMLTLAQYYEKQGQWREALRMYWEALRVARELDVPTCHIESYIQDVSWRLRKKNHKSAQYF